MFRSVGPAGQIHATARDVLTFARLHLADGVTGGGTRVLSAASARAMRDPQVEVPDPYSLGSHWGLGWILMTWDGRPVYGHDGNTLGQSAFLRLVPDADIAICLLTNGGHGRDLYQDIFSEILTELTGLSLPPPLEPAKTGGTVDLSRYAGRYAREGVELTFAAEADRLVATVRSSGLLAAAVGGEQPPFEVLPVSDDLFVAKQPSDTSWAPVVFFRLDDGRQYVHVGARATPRVD
jgi:CubicO group peptidase (beta-lactamase class C family)